MSDSIDYVPLATVVRTGLVTVQDAGRTGYAHVGVPSSGAWHRANHQLAIDLVHGQTADARSTLEILGTGLSLTFHEHQVIAVVGAASVRIDGHNAATGVALRVAPTSVIDIEHRGPGPTYLALSGWRPRLVLGSSATDSFSGLGGPSGDGKPIAPAQVLWGTPTFDSTQVGCFVRTMHPAPASIRVIPADTALTDTFCRDPWRVESSARSGTRLAGVAMPTPGSIPSTPVVPGAIQLTPNGTAIVLGPDGGLTGGYPVIGVVISADLDRIAELTVGEQIRFQQTDLTSALVEFTSREERLATAIVRSNLLT